MKVIEANVDKLLNSLTSEPVSLLGMNLQILDSQVHLSIKLLDRTKIITVHNLRFGDLVNYPHQNSSNFFHSPRNLKSKRESL
jgi:hypothetical protein